MNAESRNIGENRTVDLNDCVQLGKLVGFWGVKGWLKVFSYTRPRKNISQYGQWLLVKPSNKKNRNNTKSTQSSFSSNRNTSEQKLVSVVAVSITNCKEQGQHIVAKIDGIDYRDQAEELLGYEVFIDKTQLKPLKKGEFYWSDMLECEVTNLQGVTLGNVHSMMETGANDVLVVRQQLDKIDNEAQADSDITNTLDSTDTVEHLIPYSEDIVLSVDVEKKIISVDWGEDYLVQEMQNKPKSQKKLTKQDRAEQIRLKKLTQQQADSEPGT